MRDPGVVDDQREALDQRQARDLHGRQIQGARQRQLLVREHRERQMQPRGHLGLVRVALGREAEHLAAPAAFSSANRSRNAQVCGVQPRAPGIMSQSSTRRSCRARRCADRRTPRSGHAAPTARLTCLSVGEQADRSGSVNCSSRLQQICAAPPSSAGAGIRVQSTSSRFLLYDSSFAIPSPASGGPSPGSSRASSRTRACRAASCPLQPRAAIWPDHAR